MLTGMHSSFDVERRDGALLQYHGMVFATILGDKHDLNKHPGLSRRLFQEKGTMAAYWTVRGTGGNKQIALVNRSGLGRIVLMHTMDESLGKAVTL